MLRGVLYHSSAPALRRLAVAHNTRLTVAHTARCAALLASTRCTASSTSGGAKGGDEKQQQQQQASTAAPLSAAGHSNSSSSPSTPAASGSASSTQETAGKHKAKIQIAVVGSGPSGCFVASYLTRKNPDIHVDVYERLPVPFGLCRYGVAPDHPDVKNVEKQFMELFQSGRVTWIGNVEVGREIPTEAILQHYSAVVFATGADSSRKLNIAGEDLGGVLSARDLVSYYNTLPFPLGSPRFCPFDLDRTQQAVVIGNGNVAMDVVRVLSAPYKYFGATDMNCVAIKELMKNRIREINVVARRGVEHAAFAIAEFRELTTYQPETVKVHVDAFSLEDALKHPGRHNNARAHKRLMELVHKSAVSEEVMVAEAKRLAANADGELLHAAAASSAAAVTATSAAASTSPPTRGPCDVRFRFNMKPIRILPSKHRKNYVGGVLFEGTDSNQEKTYCVVPCDVVLTSVGYRSDRILGIPFDDARGVIPNTRGRVEGLPRVYCSGWVRNGAQGVILHSVNDAQDTVASILEDIASNVIPTTGTTTATEEEGGGVSELPPLTSTVTTMHGKYGLVDYFVSKKMEPVSVAGLKRILHTETERGVDLGKRAEKMESVRDMLDVALGGAVGKKTHERFRGITPARSEAMLYLKELLDDDTDLAPLAQELASDFPRRMAAEHPSGPITTPQL